MGDRFIIEGPKLLSEALRYKTNGYKEGFMHCPIWLEKKSFHRQQPPH
jgi:hypothetical protein